MPLPDNALSSDVIFIILDYYGFQLAFFQKNKSRITILLNSYKFIDNIILLSASLNKKVKNEKASVLLLQLEGV